MDSMYYKVVQISQYEADLETQLNNIGVDGYELVGIYNNMAILISGSSGISVSGVVILPDGVISSSGQIVESLPIGTISSSIQVQEDLPDGTISSSTQIQTNLPTGVVSSSSQYPGWVTSSAQINYTSLQNIPSDIVSSSTQVQILLPSSTVSSSAQVKLLLPNGTVSSSTQASTWTVASSSFATNLGNWIFPLNAPDSPTTGSAFFSASALWIYDGTQFLSFNPNP